MKTKPNWYKSAVATDCGWVNPNTGEVLVSHRNLKTKLELENASVSIQEQVVDEIIVTEVKREEIMEQVQESVVQKRTYNKKTKVIGEVVEETKKHIIGEVVEYDLEDNKKVIGE